MKLMTFVEAVRYWKDGASSFWTAFGARAGTDGALRDISRSC
jgi:hypothetical protein